MTIRIPERSKRPGVSYAATDDGIELPVIDVTHPAFAYEPTDQELAVITERTLRGFERGRKWPGFVLRILARRSLVMRTVLAASGGVLSGIGTYLQKLGPEHVGAWGGKLDRRLLGTIGPSAIRMRLRDVARLLADSLAPLVDARPGCPVHLVNIGGGTAIDSLNALLLLEAGRPGRLAGRRLAVHVLDPDTAGPAFGTRAAAALTADGGRLAGLDLSVERLDYDWGQPSGLRALAGRISGDGAIVACSSEGGLFEYGSDAEIAANLAALDAQMPPDGVIVGSMLKEGTVGRALVTYGRLAIFLRDPGEFDQLVERAGWVVARALDQGPAYHVVAMTKAPAGVSNTPPSTAAGCRSTT